MRNCLLIRVAVPLVTEPRHVPEKVWLLAEVEGNDDAFVFAATVPDGVSAFWDESFGVGGGEYVRPQRQPGVTARDGEHPFHCVGKPAFEALEEAMLVYFHA